MIYGMNARTKKLHDEAMKLPAEDRAALADELDASLLGDDSPEEVEKAWAEEIERRVRDVEEGRVKPIPAAEVHRAIRERLRAMR
jgi:putative addiction module component (TIGR02574 family)